VFWLAVIFIPQQSFFAGEWLFGGIEPKTLAYIFVLWSLVFLLREQYFICILFAAFSTCLHLLVGGWYSLYLFIFILLKNKMNIKIILDWIVYAIILSPLIIYLYTGMLSGNETIINGVNTNEVYVFIRNPNHIGLFKSREYFLHYHAGKIFVCLIAFILSLSLYRKSFSGHLHTMNTLLIIILAQNLLFIFIAYFDRKGTFLKFYPFRGNLLAMMLFQLETLILLKEKWIPELYKWLKKRRLRWTKRIFYQVQMILLLCLCILSISFKLSNRYSDFRSEKKYWQEINSLSEHLKLNSNASDKFFMVCPENKYTVSIPRKAERDAFFYFQFIPTESIKIYEWYTHMKIQEKIRANPELLLQPDIRNECDYVVCCNSIENEHFESIFQSEHYFLYKIN
jgi:hypothetical protein